SGGNGRAELNTPQSVTAPQRRFGTRQNQPSGLSVYATTDWAFAPTKDVYGAASDTAGTDLLLANVTDFEIKAQWEIPLVGASSPFNAFYASLAATPIKSVDYPFDVLPLLANQNLR